MNKTQHIDIHNTTAEIKLNDLVPGEFGRIVRIETRSRIRQRLMDLGVIEGATVEMIRVAPLGDPLQIRVMDTHIALRRNEAELLIIKPQGAHRHGRGRKLRRRFGRKSE